MPETDIQNTDDNQIADTDTMADQEIRQTDPPTDTDTFDRAYVEKLRRENARYRERSTRVDEISQRLHTELVRATGRLADPTDLPFDAEHLNDPEALLSAITELLDRKPHLGRRTPTGDVGQGATGTAGTVDLAGILRGRAG
ncbi:hypothetical protein [Nocardia sp. CNY236]|uniref:hypothetical protein n=1 Tax=Nocardia sp. CNY236 TaxID=1169152 RepID=UPI000406F0AD|nr:hypothetical protein [Nocardia sp. CNY236]